MLLALARVDGGGLSGLAALAQGKLDDDRLVVAEYTAEGSIAPMIMLRQGRWKFTHCPVDPDQLFDIAADPAERINRAADTDCAEVVARFRAIIRQRWDLAAFDTAVRESQRNRLLIHAALRHGTYYPWDFQPLQKASERYMRNHMDLNVVESNARFPR